MNGTEPFPSGSDQLWIWSALVAAPALMFANLSLSYAFTPLFCRLGGPFALHLLCASCALPTMIMTAGSLKAWRQREDPPGGEGAKAEESLLAEAASIVASLATLVILAQWLAIWILPPCF